jgi:hypothetical protein
VEQSECIPDSLSTSDAASGGLNIQAAGSGAADDGGTFPNNECPELRRSSEPGSASTAFGTMNDRVMAMREKYEKMNDQAVQEVPYPSDSF